MNNEIAIKASNPKDAIGCKKPPLSVLPMHVLHNAGLSFINLHPKVWYMFGLGMLEGACKYGRHNYRAIGVRASVYYDAFMRHMAQHRSGEHIDLDSGLPHLIKAGTSLLVLMDAMACNNWCDDRPPAVPAINTGNMVELSAEAHVVCWWDYGYTHATLQEALRRLCDECADGIGLPEPWLTWVSAVCSDILAKYPEPKAPFTQLEHPAA